MKEWICKKGICELNDAHSKNKIKTNALEQQSEII